MTSPKFLYFAAAVATAIAGIVHLILAPNFLSFNPNGAILFFVGGAAQLFWVVPVIRRWGSPWYAVGIGGTAVLMAIWTITRFPGNPITGRAGNINEMAIILESAQAAFIGLAAAILALEAKRRLRKQA